MNNRVTVHGNCTAACRRVRLSVSYSVLSHCCNISHSAS